VAVDNPLAAIRANAPFVGRVRELDLLRAAWSSAQGGCPALVALRGEAGIGKTRLLAEVVDGLDDAAVVAGSCHESDGSRPYAPFITALRIADSQGLLADVDLPELWQRELARLLPEWAAGSSGVNAPLDGQRDRDRLFEAVRVAIAALAEKRPVLLLVDDCQWADETSLSLLGYLARGLGASRCLLVVAWRPEELNPQRRESLRSLAALGHSVSVGPLGPRDTATLVQTLAKAVQAPERFAARLHSKTGGNPLFLLETLSALFEQGTLKAVDGEWATSGGLAAGDYGPLPVPASVGLLIDSRLDRLSDDARGLLECAAVLRRDFRFDLAQAASGLPAIAALDGLDSLLAQGLVREVARRGPSAARYDFVHALVRDRVYQRLSGARRQFLHRQVAGRLEAQDNPTAERVAYHYTRGGVRDRACGWLLRAGASALAVYAAEDAAAHFGAARELAVSPEEERGALIGLGDALMLLGRGGDAVAAFNEALVSAGTGGARAEILRRIGRAQERSGSFDLALEAFEGARESLGDSVACLTGARVVDGLATVYVRLGRPAEAVALCSEALGWQLPKGGVEAEAWLRNTLGMAYLYAGDVPASLAQLRRSLELKRQLGDRLGEATLLNNIGVVYYRIGDDTRARDHYAASREAKEAIGDRYGTAIALVNLALMETHLGAFDEAQGHLTLARRRAEAVDATWLMPEIHRVAAQRAMAVGDLDRARDEAAGALQAAESLGVPAFIGVAHRVLGSVKAGEQAGAAEEHFETSLAVFEMLEDEHELAKTHQAFAEALLAEGRRDAAALHAEAAAKVFRRSGADGRLSQIERLLGR
ncbi:MAG: AAA family ATPase, partial [Anaerolineae bacterium]